MIKVLSTSALILGSLLTPAHAGQILPHLYAREYCALRDLGVSASEARAAAVAEAYVSSLPDKPSVTVGGERTTSDVVAAVRVVNEICPHHI